MNKTATTHLVEVSFIVLNNRVDQLVRACTKGAINGGQALREAELAHSVAVVAAVTSSNECEVYIAGPAA
jgi:hypothetical protein